VIIHVKRLGRLPTVTAETETMTFGHCKMANSRGSNAMTRTFNGFL